MPWSAIVFGGAGALIAAFYRPLGEAAYGVIASMNAPRPQDRPGWDEKNDGLQIVARWSVLGFGVMMVLGAIALTVAWLAGVD
jgi:hypothetical protein